MTREMTLLGTRQILPELKTSSRQLLQDYRNGDIEKLAGTNEADAQGPCFHIVGE